MQTCTVRCLRADHNTQTANRQTNRRHRRQQLRNGSLTSRHNWRMQYRSARTPAFHHTLVKTGLLARQTTLLVSVRTTARKAIRWANLLSSVSVSIVQTRAKIRRSMRTLRVLRSQRLFSPHTAPSRYLRMSQQRRQRRLQRLHCLKLHFIIQHRHRNHLSLLRHPKAAHRSLRCRAPILIHLQRQRAVPPTKGLKNRHLSRPHKLLESP